MANTLEMQMQLNKLLEEASKIVEKMTGQYVTQSKVMEQLAESVKKINEAAKAAGGNSKLAESFKDASTAATEAKDDMTVAMEEAAKKINSTTESTKGMNKGFGDTSAALTKLNAGTAIIGGIGKAISFVAQSGLAALQMIQGIGGGIFEVAKSVLAFPFKMLDGLISMASVSGSNELATELEKIRQEFGYLNKTAGGTIISLAKSMKGELANTGISTWRTFGNLVERLVYFREYAQKLGETVDAVFRNLKASQAEALGAFNKGLGLTDAGLKAVGQRSIATGQDINEINRQIGNYAIQLSEAFGVTMKQVSKDVGEMMADFEHFGHLAVKELTQAAVFTRRLGIEVKSLGKLMDKYMNFEDAADSAAHLSQTFGMNVDAFKLMQEQDPAKKLEMLRKAFYATGRTVETMTAQERRLLAQQTGLGESEVALAFAQKNRALSYDDVRKKGDAAKKSQLTQEQVLNKLAGAIERLTKSGSAMQGGFFDRFIQGFVEGISKSKDFRELMRNLAASLNIVFRAGILVGRAFADLFPGVKQFFKGLADMFNPRIMRTFMTKVVGAFREFFDALTKNPTTALPVLLDKLQQAFTDRFNAAGSGGMKVMNGIKSFLKAVGYIFLTGIREALLGLGKVIAPLINSIFNPNSLSGATDNMREAVGGLGDTLQKMFTDVFGTSGSPARAKIMESIEKFGRSLLDAFLVVLGSLVEKLPDFLGLIAGGLNSGASAISDAASDQNSVGRKFAEKWAKSMEASKPYLIKIAESVGTIFIEGFSLALKSPTARRLLSDALVALFFPVETAIDSVFKSESSIKAGKEFRKKMIEGFRALKEDLLGIFQHLKERIASAFNSIKEIGRTFFSTLFSSGPREAFNMLYEMIREPLDRNIILIKAKIISFFNELIDSANNGIRLLPQSAKSLFGFSEIPRIPIPPASENPIVQRVNQAVDAARTGSRQIQDSLSNATNTTITQPVTATTAPVDIAVEDRVSSMRSAIESARNIGRVDQAAAERSMQRLQAFAIRIGPVMEQTQTALNTAFRNIDVGKMNETIDAIKSILGGVASIKQTVTRNVGTLSVSEMMPLLNSISALTTFTTSPVMVRLAAQMSASENAARISGIQNTSNAIKDMVETINETSRELAKISPINIQTNLQRLASNLGLGNNAAYTIKNENFTVQVNVDVHIDARELEKTLVERPNTRIRHT